MNVESKEVYKFFISYRRDDYPDCVEHIRSWFGWRYGRNNVFMDFDSIPVGASFSDNIREQIRACDVVLVIISPKWIERFINDPYNENDWVRIEIGEALKEQKIVIPIYIKGASIPEMKYIPQNLRGMFNNQATWLESGKNFIDRIEGAMDSIESILKIRIQRKMEIRQMEETSPASGLALGYYVNFVRQVGNQIVYLNNSLQSENPKIGISINKQEIKISRPIKMNLIIPNKISLLKDDALKDISQTFDGALIHSESSSRPFNLYAYEFQGDYRLVDFPTPVTVLEYWLRRRLKDEGITPQSEKAQILEQEELGRFSKSLGYYIDDDSNDPLFREYIQVSHLIPDGERFEVLKKRWQ